MRKGLVFSFIIFLGFVAISVVGANVDSASQRSSRLTKTSDNQPQGLAIDTRAYRSPGRWRKVVIAAGDSEALARAKRDGAIEVADYQSFKLLMIEDAALEMTGDVPSTAGRDGATGISPLIVRDDFNVLFLRSRAIDTTADDSPGTLFSLANQIVADSSSASLSETPDRGGLRLVQFIGPVKRAWLDQMRENGFELVAYVPNNGYLLRGDSQAKARLTMLARTPASSGGGFIQWAGSFSDAYKIHPALADAANRRTQERVRVAVQFARGNSSFVSQSEGDVETVRKMAISVIGAPYNVLNFTNLRLEVDSSQIPAIAALATVVNIEPWSPPQLLDEQSAQIVAGQLTPDGKQPKAPGYLAWLAAHGFTSNFNFAIDVTDGGIDRGSIDPANLHPDFLDSSKRSRVLYARDYTFEVDPGDIAGHGTLNLSVAGGDSSSVLDSSGYSFGIGVAPLAMLGSSKIFRSTGLFDLSQPYTKLISEAYQSGARVSSNSWGARTNSYTIDSEEYDARVRDADPSQPGNQETVICFAAGNGSSSYSINSPGSAKNVISVAASESARTANVDGCGVTDAESNNAEAMAFFSSGGPVADGRIKPDITAPGTHIQGAASQNPNFDGSGVCGAATSNYFPAGQTLYTWSSGTSHSTPQVAGAAALTRQFFLNNGIDPSGALIKALLLNTSSYMTGDGAGGDLPHPRQGWGLLDMDRTFDGTPKIFVNQTTTFTDSGQEFVMTGEIKDAMRPFRVTLAWTDAPGMSTFAPWVNDLDLEVTVNGQVYHGNNFQGQVSQPGGVPDSIDNVEGVWLPAGTAGTFLVRVRATTIAGDGVPGNADSTDQDFALVVYNGERKEAPVLTLGEVTLSSGGGSLAQPGATVSMTLNVKDVSATAFSGATGTLASATTGVTVTTSQATFPSLSSGQSGSSQTPFVFTIDKSATCGSSMQFTLDLPGQQSVVRLSFNVSVGDVRPIQFFADDIESGDAKWTHGSAIKKKKLAIDTWSISTKHGHSGHSSWFSSDPPTVADSHLDTIPIQLPDNSHSIQLVFFHTFEFESSFDGGVLEISTGNDFQDLGPNIVGGGYNGAVSSLGGTSQNPLAGRKAWVGGRFGAFQPVVVDLSSFSGKTVIIRFRFGSDQSVAGQGWYIDDVQLNGNLVSCSPTP